MAEAIVRDALFLSTPPRRGRPARDAEMEIVVVVSIHAPA